MNKSKIFNSALWIAQGLLAALFLMTGFMKLTSTIDSIAMSLPWVKEAPALMIRLLGLVEILGGIGIILPSILRIKPQLVPLAAIGIILLMISAMVFHISRGEASVIGFNLIIIAIAVFVWWGRTKKIPVLSR